MSGAPPTSSADLGAAEEDASDPDFADFDVEDDRFRCFAAWAGWTRDSVPVQFATWLLVTVYVFGPSGWATNILRWPGLAHLIHGGSAERTWQELMVGWGLATLMNVGWASGVLQLVFTFEQRAMTFPPWSILVFWKGPPSVGSVIHFSGADGRGYIRRVTAVKDGGLVTAGDLPGSPEDRPLYSTDGSAELLDEQQVRGTLAVGPFSHKVFLSFAVGVFACSPPVLAAFWITNQPLMYFWCSVCACFAYNVFIAPLS